MSDRNIGTRRESDFRALMRLLGLEARFEDYWRAVRTLRAAHRRAGMQIRRALIGRIGSIDVDDLWTHGRVDIELPDSEGGKLTAFRIDGIAPDTSWIPATQIGEVLEGGYGLSRA